MRFDASADWKVVSALEDTADLMISATLYTQAHRCRPRFGAAAGWPGGGECLSLIVRIRSRILKTARVWIDADINPLHGNLCVRNGRLSAAGGAAIARDGWTFKAAPGWVVRERASDVRCRAFVSDAFG